MMTVAMFAYFTVAGFFLGVTLTKATQDPTWRDRDLPLIVVVAALWPIILLIPGKSK